MRGAAPSVTALTIRSSGTSLASPKPPLSSNVRCSMKILSYFLTSLLLLAPIAAIAQDQLFAGEWSIDLRSEQEKQKEMECGEAGFSLQQSGDAITGSHQFYTVGCGRINEGGPASVHGIAVGNTATLVVTSGRTGTIVMGKAVLDGNSLRWETREEIYAGTQGDSPLILSKGTLKRAPNSGQR
jgi:hypothetical protein